MRTSIALDDLKQEDSLFAQVIDVIEQKLLSEIYLVGGYLRDKALNRLSLDIDLVIKGDALTFSRQLADALKGSFFVLDEIFEVARVVIKQKRQSRTVDVAALRGPIDRDLLNRDFTINALALDINKLLEKKNLQLPLDLIDVTVGWSDLQQENIKLVSEDGFRDDPVRLLRAVRLSQELGFKIDHQTSLLIRKESSLLARSSPERLTAELLTIFSLPGVGRGVSMADKLLLLEQVFPGLETLKGLTQNGYHHLDVWDHTLLTMENLEKILLKLPTFFPENEANIYKHLEQPVYSSYSRRTFLFLSALLHDIGKKKTRMIDEKGAIHFYGHSKTGAEATREMLFRLRLSKKAIQIVTSIVLNHMRPAHLTTAGELTQRAIDHFLRETGDVAVEVALLSLADGLSATGSLSTDRLRRKQIEVYSRLVDNYFLSQKKPYLSLISGDELMAAFDLSPSPLIGELLEKVRRLHLEGKIHKRTEAVDEIAKTLARTKL